MEKIIKDEKIFLKLFGIKILQWNKSVVLKDSIINNESKYDVITKKDYEILEEYKKYGLITDNKYWWQD